MKFELLAHKLAYTLLILGLGLLLVGFLAVWPDRSWQRVIAVLMSLFYFTWGMVTHLHARQVTRQLVYEYLGVAVLAGLILVFVTL